MLSSHNRALLNYEISSIVEDREKSMIFCNDQLFEVKSKWDHGELKSILTTKEIYNKCGNTKPFFIHTHILHTSDPSDEDFDGYDNEIFQGFCVVGIDGYQCYNNNQHQIEKVRWINDFLPIFKSINGLYWKGRNLFCDDIGKQYYCELNGENNSIYKIGIFDKLTTKDGKMSLKTGDSDITLQSKKDQQIQCFGTQDGRELSCIVSNL